MTVVPEDCLRPARLPGKHRFPAYARPTQRKGCSAPNTLPKIFIVPTADCIAPSRPLSEHTGDVADDQVGFLQRHALRHALSPLSCPSAVTHPHPPHCTCIAPRKRPACWLPRRAYATADAPHRRLQPRGLCTLRAAGEKAPHLQPHYVPSIVDSNPSCVTVPAPAKRTSIRVTEKSWTGRSRYPLTRNTWLSNQRSTTDLLGRLEAEGRDTAPCNVFPHSLFVPRPGVQLGCAQYADVEPIPRSLLGRIPNARHAQGDFMNMTPASWAEVFPSLYACARLADSRSARKGAVWTVIQHG